MQPTDIDSHYLAEERISRREGLRLHECGFRKTDLAVSIFGTRELVEVFGKGG